MGVALYRKYRSRSLDEVVGQEHITTTLKNAIKSGKLSHAYLLTGPRGVGKTSVARILAYEINGIDYNDGAAHMDIIEIDAASNRRIDEVRDLRDKVHVLPSQAKYKVYIIDEVHMLTREAFNALLKTLEEPPAHVIFILATTEAHKLPETIISRTQHFAFKPIDTPTLVGHLQEISKLEKLQIEEAALQLIADHGGGSFRDSISLLDQVRNSRDKVTRDDVLSLLGIAPAESLENLYGTVTSGDAKTLLAALQALREQGITASIVAKQLGDFLRQKLLAGEFTNMTLLRALLEVPASSNPERLLEITLLEALPEGQIPRPVAPPQKHTAPVDRAPTKAAPVAAAAPTQKSEPKQTTQQEPKKDTENVRPETEHRQKPKGTSTFTLDDWPAVLTAVKKQYNTLYGILRMAEPSLSDETLTLTFRFAFHEKQLKESKNQKILSQIIEQMFSAPVTIACLVQAKTNAAKTAKPQKSEAIETVSNIFGSAEVLES